MYHSIFLVFSTYSTSLLYALVEIPSSANTDFIDTSSEFYTSLRHGVVLLLLILPSLPFAHFLLFPSRPITTPFTSSPFNERYRLTTYPSSPLPLTPISSPTTPSTRSSHFLFSPKSTTPPSLLNGRTPLTSRYRQSSLPITLSTPLNSHSKHSPQPSALDAHVNSLLTNPPDFPSLSDPLSSTTTSRSLSLTIDTLASHSSYSYSSFSLSLFLSKIKRIYKRPFWLRSGYLTALVYDPFNLFTPPPMTLTAYLILISTTLCFLYPPLIWLVFTFAEFSESQLLTWTRSMTYVCLLVILPFAYLNEESPDHFIPLKETLYTWFCFCALLYVLYSVLPESMKDWGHILCLCVSVVYIIQPTTSHYLPLFFHSQRHSITPAASIPLIWTVFWGVCTVCALILPFYSHFLLRTITVLHFLILQLNGLLMLVLGGQRPRSIHKLLFQLALALAFVNYLAYLVPSLILVKHLDFWNTFFSIVLRIQYFRCFFSFLRPRGFSLRHPRSKKTSILGALS